MEGHEALATSAPSTPAPAGSASGGDAVSCDASEVVTVLSSPASPPTPSFVVSDSPSDPVTPSEELVAPWIWRHSLLIMPSRTCTLGAARSRVIVLTDACRHPHESRLEMVSRVRRRCRFLGRTPARAFSLWRGTRPGRRRPRTSQEDPAPHPLARLQLSFTTWPGLYFNAEDLGGLLPALEGGDTCNRRRDA